MFDVGSLMIDPRSTSARALARKRGEDWAVVELGSKTRYNVTDVAYRLGQGSRIQTAGREGAPGARRACDVVRFPRPRRSAAGFRLGCRRVYRRRSDARRSAGAIGYRLRPDAGTWSACPDCAYRCCADPGAVLFRDQCLEGRIECMTPHPAGREERPYGY